MSIIDDILAKIDQVANADDLAKIMLAATRRRQQLKSKAGIGTQDVMQPVKDHPTNNQ